MNIKGIENTNKEKLIRRPIVGHMNEDRELFAEFRSNKNSSWMNKIPLQRWTTGSF